MSTFAANLRLATEADIEPNAAEKAAAFRHMSAPGPIRDVNGVYVRALGAHSSDLGALRRAVLRGDLDEIVRVTREMTAVSEVTEELIEGFIARTDDVA
ncbi:hypothetical protein CcI49_23140 [Frankia sp. CcI49]|uniref:hypothetical protein n=1 Tax=Frankia sp. CcI49 TaxID=1745382 RepID=UPI0009765211|nr:hypothetical protein [Frankia sp. CcI49]ONH58353.1 hypothetical protein CcI49_23140 [Frankia sp. CcI49]